MRYPSTTRSKKPEKPSGGHKGGKGGGYTGHKQKYTTEIGLVGEAYVYEKLVEKYGQDKVSWVSENAKKANVNPQGGESYGYDIRTTSMRTTHPITWK